MSNSKELCAKGSVAKSNFRLERLSQIIMGTSPRSRAGPRFLQKPAKLMPHWMSSRISCDEVYPRIFVGDATSAKNKEFLDAVGITHVLNAAEGSAHGQVATGMDYYSGTGISYIGIDLSDTCNTPISQYFDYSSCFIHSAVNSGGKILVHCHAGVSRSVTLVLAYLISRKSMSTEEALRQVCSQRRVNPNSGFLQQLLQLESEVEVQRKKN